MVTYQTAQRSESVAADNGCSTRSPVAKRSVLQTWLTRAVKAVGWLVLASILGAGSVVVYLLSIFELL